MPNTEAKNARFAKTRMIGSTLSSEALVYMYTEIGIIIIVASAVKNEILVNILRSFLFKKFTSLYENYIIIGLSWGPNIGLITAVRL